MGKASRKKKQSPKKNTTTHTASSVSDNTGEQNAGSTAAKTTVKVAKKTPKRGRKVLKKTNYVPWIIGAVVLVGALAFPTIQRQFKMRTATGDFAQLVREGNSEMNRLQEKHRDLGRTHVPFGSEITYNSSPPTTGPHYGSWINPGYYIEEQEPRQLVHSLEHGHIVAYYGDEVDDDTKNQLIDWTNDFRNTWGGFIAAPLEGTGSGIIMTAWRHTLRFDEFDPAIAAAFIDKHRGRGPENPIR